MQVDGSFLGVAMGAGFAVNRPAAGARNRELVQAIREVNESGRLGDKNMIVFIMDHGTRQPVMRIVNVETKEVVAQIPSETVLRVAEVLRALVG